MLFSAHMSFAVATALMRFSFAVAAALMTAALVTAAMPMLMMITMYIRVIS